jgi:hypothetical protein
MSWNRFSPKNDSPSFLFALCHDNPDAVVQDRFTTDNLRMGFPSAPKPAGWACRVGSAHCTPRTASVATNR